MLRIPAQGSCFGGKISAFIFLRLQNSVCQMLDYGVARNKWRNDRKGMRWSFCFERG